MKRRLCLRVVPVLIGSVGSALNMVGCASKPQAADSSTFWTGRLALYIHGPTPASHTATFELQGSADRGMLNLLSPIGVTVVRAQWAPDQAWLEQGTQKQHYPNIGRLLEAATGAALPLEALLDWLQGKPSAAPGWSVDLTQHAQGRILAQRSSPEPVVRLLIFLQQP